MHGIERKKLIKYEGEINLYVKKEDINKGKFCTGRKKDDKENNIYFLKVF